MPENAPEHLAVSDLAVDRAPSHRARLGMTAVLLIPFLLMGAAFLVGTQQPATRQVVGSIEVGASPRAVQSLLASPERQSSWWRQIERVEDLEQAGGAVRQIFPEGRTAHLTVVSSSASEVVWRIADPAGPYRGVWRFELALSAPDGAAPGTRVTLIEDARLGNPFARLLVAWAGGGGGLVDDCLHDLAAWFERDASESAMEGDHASDGEVK